jgi:hypothetical protein
VNVPVCVREKSNPEPTVTTPSARARNESSKSACAKYPPPGSSTPVSVRRESQPGARQRCRRR